MVKDGLEKRFEKEKILSEEAIFREYVAYTKGNLPDELGERGKRIRSDADTISRILGYPNVQSWIDSYCSASKNQIKDSPLDAVEKLREDYNKLSHLGKGLRDVNQAISIIGNHRDIYPIENTDSLFFKSYEEKRKIISQAKKYYQKVFSSKKEVERHYQ